MVQVVLAFRGTAGLKDVLADADAKQARSAAPQRAAPRGDIIARRAGIIGTGTGLRHSGLCVQVPWGYGGKHGHVHDGMYAQFQDGLSSLHSTVRECGHV